MDSAAHRRPAGPRLRRAKRQCLRFLFGIASPSSDPRALRPDSAGRDRNPFASHAWLGAADGERSAPGSFIIRDSELAYFIHLASAANFPSSDSSVTNSVLFVRVFFFLLLDFVVVILLFLGCGGGFGGGVERDESKKNGIKIWAREEAARRLSRGRCGKVDRSLKSYVNDGITDTPNAKLPLNICLHLIMYVCGRLSITLGVPLFHEPAPACVAGRACVPYPEMNVGRPGPHGSPARLPAARPLPLPLFREGGWMMMRPADAARTNERTLAAAVGGGNLRRRRRRRRRRRGTQGDRPACQTENESLNAEEKRLPCAEIIEGGRKQKVVTFPGGHAS